MTISTRAYCTRFLAGREGLQSGANSFDDGLDARV